MIALWSKVTIVLKVTEQRVLTYCPVSPGQIDLPAGSKASFHPIPE